MIWSDRDYGLTHSGFAGSCDPPRGYSQERGLGARIRRHASEERGHAYQRAELLGPERDGWTLVAPIGTSPANRPVRPTSEEGAASWCATTKSAARD